jgi:hypothetical protein
MAKRALSTLAISGAVAALTMAAAAPTALAASGASANHHHHHHAKDFTKHVSVHGLVAHHKGRHVTVFAKTAKVGARTSHNKRVHLTFARAVHHRRKMHVGDHITVHGIAHSRGHNLTIFRHNDETITPAPASLFFGTVVSVSDEQFVLNEHTRDNGRHEDGDDHGHGGDGDDQGQDNVTRQSDHGRGGLGPSSHLITVDDANATITVDGSTDVQLAEGDTVAVLGEATDDTVVAADVFGYTVAPSFLRGDITDINGQVVTVGDDDQGEDVGDDGMRPAHDGCDGAVGPARGGDDECEPGDDDNPVTVDLSEVPLALNGALNASVSDLSVGDKLIVLGDMNSESGEFDANVAFAFNSDDNRPCPEGDDDHGGHGEGSDD